MIPSVLATEKIAFICLPEPDPNRFQACIKISDKEIIDNLEKYARIWNNRGEKIKNIDDIKNVFAESIRI